MRRRSGNYWVHFLPAAIVLAVAFVHSASRATADEPPPPAVDLPLEEVEGKTALGAALRKATPRPETIAEFMREMAAVGKTPPRGLAFPVRVHSDRTDEGAAAPFPFTVAKETTVLTEPLRPDGAVDYVAALNAEAGKGVTPQNNAAVLLLRACGPLGTDIDKREKLFRLLGMERLPDDGEYVLQDQTFVEQRAEHRRGVSDRQEQLQGRFNRQLEKAKRSAWSSVDCPLVAGWLTANEKPLELAIEASRRTHFFVPLIADRPTNPLRTTADMFGFAQCGDLRSLLTVRAMRRFNDNDFEGGRETLLASHRLARLLGRSFGIGNCDLAAAWDAELCAAERGAADSGKLSVEQIRSLQTSLDQLPPLPRPTAQIAKFERYCLLEELAYALGQKTEDETKDGLDDLDWLLAKLTDALTDGDEAARWMNGWVDRWVESSTQLPGDRNGGVLARMSADHQFLLSELYSDRATLQYLIGTKAWRGRLRAADAARDFTRTALCAAEQEAAAATDARLTRVALALATYKLAHGEFPTELSKLVSAHLPFLPRDTFTSAEFRYHRTPEGYLLYSLGRNGKDDGGHNPFLYGEDELADDDESPRGDDIVVRLPPPPPAERTLLPWEAVPWAK